ncbi:MAG: FAD-dependent oxidoreductase [Fimbriimonadaceae bacterium]|nr:FAD-dependent oxidoreductase [Fimbriimonadaceae bacterium]
MSAATYHEPPRELPLVAQCDVIVAGGGPAGVAAALAAARLGARVRLLETHGQLGGIWTSGALCWLLDHQHKRGLLPLILARLAARDGQLSYAYDVETMKLVLDELCAEVGVAVRLHTRVVAAGVADRQVTAVLTESKSGREAWSAPVCIDCTGDGDLAAWAGCRYEVGRPGSGECQPLSLMALLGGLDHAALQAIGVLHGQPQVGQCKVRFLAELARAGVQPSYSQPTLFALPGGLVAMMANHEYGVRCDDASALSAATSRARAEVFGLTTALRALGGPWAGLRIVATGAQIGVREGRRIAGRYTVTADDLITGARHDDAVCRVTFPVDVHATNPAQHQGYSGEGVRAQPYDIPLRALLAADVDNLLLAGRCLSGDFIAHSSYRVTGNAVALGQAAGVCAALAAARGCQPAAVPFAAVAGGLEELANWMQ